MRSRILLVLLLAVSLALVPALASGATPRKRDLTATLHMAVIGENGDNGAVFAGELVGRPIPRAAVILRNSVEGTTSTGTAILYAKRQVPGHVQDHRRKRALPRRYRQGHV